ncbi:PD40 domain-containing protein [bacterium AH-315-P07]|nr:PD40 domain-containing protein [bacterium AH-315-P07]
MFASLLTVILSALPQEGQIAYLNYTQTSGQVMLLDLASETITAIGPGKHDGPPQWSPDGKRLAFSTATEKGSSIAIYTLADRSIEIIRHKGVNNIYPAWNLEGTLLAYQTGRFPNTRISVFDFQAESETVWGTNGLRHLKPMWMSSVGFTKGAVNALKPRDLDTYDFRQGSIAAQWLWKHKGHWTTDLVALIPEHTVRFPEMEAEYRDRRFTEWAVAPANKERSFVFESNNGGDREIFLINRATLYDLSNHRAADINPVWSPDARWIAFESFRGGRRGIYRSHRDSGRLFTVLISESSDFWSPTWVSDSEHFVCVTNQSGSARLLLSNLDGSEIKLISPAIGEVGHPAWRP